MPETPAKETGITIHLDERARKITLRALRKHVVALLDGWSLLGHADNEPLEEALRITGETIAALEKRD